MFLRATRRRKDGKEHRYFSVVENVRRPGRASPYQKTLLYLGELNDAQSAAWTQALAVFDPDTGQTHTLSLFPEDRAVPAGLSAPAVSLRVSEYSLSAPRQYGACWLGCQLWDQLGLEAFWSSHLGASREGTQWARLLQVLVLQRLIAPGSEWRAHRLWYDQTALKDLLGEDFGWGGKDQLYAVLDRLLPHRAELFQHLRQRWADLFGAKYQVLLYDLTSTYFEGAAEEIPKAEYGYSRDHRPNCKQVVIALVITPEGFPLAYEVLPGSTQDRTTLPQFLERIETLYGKAERIWIMDRGIPTEEQLRELRAQRPELKYLVGTPRARVKETHAQWESLAWTKVQGSVEVKLFTEAQELYVVAKSEGRQQKELAIRRKKLARYLRALRGMRNEKSRDRLLMRVGAAKAKAGRAQRFVTLSLPTPEQAPGRESFSFRFDRPKLKEAELYDGHYLLRSNLTAQPPEGLWKLYLLLVQIEAVFRSFKNDLGLRPIYHQNASRVEAHIFVCFQAYCLYVTLQKRLAALAPGLTVRQALDQLSGVQMLDVSLPTTDGRLLVMSRYTQPEPTVRLLLGRLGLSLPEQSPPRLSAAHTLEPTAPATHPV